MRKKLIKNSQPFGKNFQKTIGVFLTHTVDNSTIYKRRIASSLRLSTRSFKYTYFTPLPRCIDVRLYRPPGWVWVQIKCGFLLARRYASAGNTDRNVSVCPSVTSRYCVKTKKASVMISSPSGSPTILAFWSQISSQNSKGFPERGLKKGWGWENSAIF